MPWNSTFGSRKVGKCPLQGKMHLEGLFSLQEAFLKKNRSEQILGIAQNDAQEENQGRRYK